MPMMPTERYRADMDIISAVFIENIDIRTVEGPSARLDLTGVHFSSVAPSPLPLTWAPHLLVIVHAPEGTPNTAALEVVYKRGEEQMARNVQPLEVEGGKFNYRLVRAELEFEEFGTIHAECRLDLGPTMTVPFTLLPPETP